MSKETTHELVALQFNISSGSSKKGQPRPASKTCAKFLIREYIKRTRPDILPAPTFVALHDGVSNLDCNNIQTAFRERAGCNAELTILPSAERKEVRLLYDQNTVTSLTDNNYILAQDDFFGQDNGDDVVRDRWNTKSRQLFERIDGGLFQHKSTQFIVAISYHGINKSTTDREKKDYVKELLSTLERKYNHLNPFYLIFGDFNLSLDADGECLLKGWKYYPENSTRITARCLRPQSPIDYVLVKAPCDIEGIHSPVVKEFSPVPLECSMIEDDMYYWFSNQAGLIQETSFTANNDLRLVKKSNATLKGVRHLREAYILDEFEEKESIFINVKDSTLCFDHDFLFFTAKIPQTNNRILRQSIPPPIVERSVSPNPRRTKQAPKLGSNVSQIISRLRNDVSKIIDKQDIEWLKATNEIIRGYNLGMDNVKELLLAIVFSDY